MSRRARNQWVVSSVRAVLRRAAKQRSARGTPFSRRLRVEPLEDRRLLSITVNTLVDEADGSIVDGDISLRDAIALAPAAETIDFAPALTAGGPALLTLTLGQLTIANDLTIGGPGAILLTIDASGNDPTPAVNDGNGTRVFLISDGNAVADKTVAIGDLTLTGGDVPRGIVGAAGGAIYSLENLTIGGVTITGNSASVGGAIRILRGTVTVTDSTISGNSVSGFIFDEDGNLVSGGGGISSSGTLNLVSSTINGNSASGPGGGSGGGIFRYAGVVNITSSTISGNTATASGGGIYGTVSITSSTVSGNSAGGYGGGIFASGTISSSTISGNSALNARGGGAAAFGSMTFLNSTISGNTAFSGGGGIFRFTGTLELHHTTVAENTTTAGGSGGGILLAGGTVPILSHSIVANNSAGVPNDIGPFGAPLLDADFSLIEVPGGVPVAGMGNIIGIDPLLAPLADNGGPTQTHALRGGSLAADAGDPAAVAGVGGVPIFDQRGDPFSRVVGGVIDIGSYETTLGSLLVDTLLDEADGDYSVGDLSLREAIEFANATTRKDTIEFAPSLTAGGPATIVLMLGELLISEELTIVGPGGNLLTIDAGDGADGLPGTGDGSRVFNVNDGGIFVDVDVEIIGLTIIGGDVAGKGGGIYNDESLTVTGVTITGNFAFGDNGGGICSLGPLVVAGSTIAANVADSGGGIFSSHSGLTVVTSAISGNLAVLAPGGGGITGFYSGMAVLSSTISGNLSVDDGGGILVFIGSTLDVMHSTIADNVADADDDGFGVGGGIEAVGAFLPPTLDHTIVGNNVTGLVAMVPDDIVSFAAVPADFSLVEVPPGAGLIGMGNIVGLDPVIGPLADNGGATFTHALLPGSPAIDMGDPLAVAGVGGVPDFDQRGAPFARVVGGGIDIGAFEVQQPALPGDYNEDNSVDAADYVVWRKTLGTMGVPAFSGADGDGDTTIDQDDYGVWRAHFGETLPGAGTAASAPEESPGVAASSDSELVPQVETAALASVVTTAVAEPVAAAADSPEILAVDLPHFASGRSAARPRVALETPVSAAQYDEALVQLLASRTSIHGRRTYESAASASEVADDVAVDDMFAAVDGVFEKDIGQRRWLALTR